MRATLDDGKSVGGIRRITSQFSFHGDETFLQENIRAHSALEPHGCLGDLGWYCIRFTLWAMNWQPPIASRAAFLPRRHKQAHLARCRLSSPGELFFEGGASASFFCLFIAENQQWAVVSGDKGLVRVSDFVLPFKDDHTRYGVTNSDFRVAGCQFDMIEGRQDVAAKEPSNNGAHSQEAELFRTFSDFVLSGKPDPHWPFIALQTQTAMEACWRSARNGSAAVTL